MEQTNLPVDMLVDGLMNHLKEIGFKDSTRNRLFAYYKIFIKYCSKKRITQFSLDIGKEFLKEHHKHDWTDFGVLSISQNYLQRHIWMLYEFQAYGEIRQKRRLKKCNVLECFEETVEAYITSERERGLKETTLKTKEHSVKKIFNYFEAAGLKSPKEITAGHVYGFLAEKSYYSAATKEAYQYTLRSLLHFLYNTGLCGKELTQLFPVITLHTKNSYPSYFTPDSISRLLQSVHTETAGGKRDYLILLLATTLGIRCIDICRLTLDNIDWEKRTISFIQSKTGGYLSLSINDELLMALLDYIKNARPDCNYREILISNRAPIRPYSHRTFYEMLQKYLKKVEINIEAGQKHGLHSMRSSLASNMLRDGTPMPVISNILGHKYADTTSIYLKIDLEGLRKAALEVPQYE